jgi:hypothetical protein
MKRLIFLAQAFLILWAISCTRSDGPQIDTEVPEGYVCAKNASGNAQVHGLTITVVGEFCRENNDGIEVCSRQGLTRLDSDIEGCFKFLDGTQDNVDIFWDGICFTPGEKKGVVIQTSRDIDLEQRPEVDCHISNNGQMYETCSQYIVKTESQIEQELTTCETNCEAQFDLSTEYEGCLLDCADVSIACNDICFTNFPLSTDPGRAECFQACVDNEVICKTACQGACKEVCTTQAIKDSQDVEILTDNMQACCNDFETERNQIPGDDTCLEEQ